jgi:mono/diheme cytochrome c family protein
MLIVKPLNRRIYTLVLGCLVLAGARAGLHAQAAADTASSGEPTTNGPTYLHDIQPLFLGKCEVCHNGEDRYLPNWANYAAAYQDRLEIKRRVWDSWKGNYYKQAMPAGNCPEMRSTTEADRELIRTWVDNGAPYGVVSNKRAQNKEERIEFGKRLFTAMCATCHQLAGQGVANKYPPLAGSDFLNADKDRAIMVLLHGRQGPITVNGVNYNNTMPSFPLSDEDIANALTYTYNNFGNSGKEVTPAEVKVLRAEKVQPQTPTKTGPSQFE